MKRFLSIFLSIMMLITFIPIDSLTAFAADDVIITGLEPNKVSANNGGVVKIIGSGFGTKKSDIAVKVFVGGVLKPIGPDMILSVNNTQISVMVPDNGGNSGKAQLIVDRTDVGSAIAGFDYVPDPEITKIVTNTEVIINRNANGDIIQNPDGTTGTKATFLEIFGNNINLSGANEIESGVDLQGEYTTQGTVVEQRPGYIKVKLPENFEFNKEYEITIRNKYGGEARYPKNPADPKPNINLAKHDITQLSTLRVNIGDKLGIQGTKFPEWDTNPSLNNLKVYIVNPSGENEASIFTGTTPSEGQIDIEVPQVTTSGYQKIKVVDTSNSLNHTAVTFIDRLQVLPTPGYFEVKAVSPNAGPKNGGTEVRLIGTGLNPGMKIKFGDRYATGVELDTEMSVGNTTVLKAITPSSNTIGPVTVTVENPIDNGMRQFQGLFRYTEVENSLVFIDLNPTEGFESGGERVTLTGLNFQRTIKNDTGKIVADEDSYEIVTEEGKANRVLVLKKDDIKDYQVPGTNNTTDVKRIREVRVYFGGEKAEILPIKVDDGSFVATNINPDTGQQGMIVLTPQIALDPRTNTPVDVVIEIITKYEGIKSGDEYEGKTVDRFTERSTSSRKYIYKPVPSAPELEVVHNEKFEGIPLIDDKTPMAKGPAGSTVYIYGLDFRPDAKVYFFKETNKPLNEYLVARNQGQVISVSTLGYEVKGKMAYRIEVVAPDIKELGATTVLVQNGDKGRTKTLNEYVAEGKHNEDEIRVRQFDYMSTPVIKEITPDFGSTNTAGKNPHHPVAMINGDMFLVDNKEDISGQTQVIYPTIYAVPRSVLTQELLADLGSYEKYRAKTLEVTAEKSGKLITLDGVKDRVGTKISVRLPSVEPSEKGYRDIIIINPDGGVARATDAFEYMEPKKQPEIISVSPDKGSVDGGQKVVITGKNLDYDIREILLTVTIGGEIAKIDKVERAASGGDIVHITITTPKGTEGEKILQVLNNRDGGTGESTYTYTRVSTNPKITTIAPKHGGAYTQVIIKGDDFVLPNLSATDRYERMGTRVLFNEHELNLITTSKELKDGSTVTSRVYVADKNTIILTLPENLPLGLKDVTIINPDTTRVTVKNGFTYLSPISEPKIDSIIPNEGTRDGGTKVVIIGEDFRENNIEVYFGEKKGIVERVLEEEGQKYKLLVTTPSYTVDEKITDRVKVPVTVINSDGGSATIQDGFTFRVPGSFPKISGLDPKEGSTAGYQTVVISGDDFRFDDVNENGKPDPGEALPKVYFGWEEAVDVQYSSYGALIVKTPPGEKEGAVDVTVTNPDAGTVVLKNGFTYRMSKPTITSITPDTVTKFGGTEVTIVGAGFIEGKGVGDQTGETPLDPGDITTPIYGVDIDVEVILGNEEASSRITGGHGEVIIGDLRVTYDNRDASNPNLVTVKYKNEAEKTFKLKPRQSRIIILQTGDGTKGTEGVKIALKDNTLIVTRRLAPAVKYVDSNTLVMTTPAMDNIGTQSVRIVNRDGGTAKGSIIIKHPDSKPEITNIDPKREVFKADGSNEVDYYAIESTIDGGITFTIEGKDFRKGVRVMIGSQEAEIISKNNEETKLIVRAPKGREIDINKPLRIIIINEDGESADSALSKIGEAKVPAYYIYRAKESSPTIESVIPNRGSAAGGEEIRILGNDFRIENITVRIGAREATVVIKESSYKELVIITPPSDILGPVDVFIRNEGALGEVILVNGFTYYSVPTITSVTPNQVHNTGGQKVTIRGNNFLPGVKVYIGDTPATGVELINEQTLEIITPPGELGPKDVRIENTDGGKYTLENGITYILPLPEGPTGFVAYPGHERSITLRWNQTPGADRFKIFGSTRSGGEYEFIGETTELEYIIKDLKPDTRYYFRLWAINKYGESIDYDYASTTTLKTRNDDGSDKYDQKETTETVVNYSNGLITVDLPSQYSSRQYTVDLTDNKYSKYDKIKVVVPLSAISYSSGGAYINTNDISLYIPMYNLMYSTYYTAARNEKDANVIITVSKLDSTEKARLTKGLTRKEKAKSDAYEVDIALQKQRETNAIKITGGISLSLTLEKASMKKDNLYLGRYNSRDNKLEKASTSITEAYDYNKLYSIYNIAASIEENGKFIVIYKE